MGPQVSEVTRAFIVRDFKRTGNIKKAARDNGVDARTARLWVDRYAETGGVKDKPGRGRKLQLTPLIVGTVVKHLTTKAGATRSSAARELQQQHLTPSSIHPTTISKAISRLRKQGIDVPHYVSGKPKKALDSGTREKRLQFAKTNQHTDWSSVLFTDRKRFAFRYPGEKVCAGQWVLPGQEREAHMVNHASTYNLYCGMCVAGTTTPCQVAGTTGTSSLYKTKGGVTAKNITQDEYNQSVLNTFLEDGVKLFHKNGKRSWALMQDNDGAHAAAADVLLQFSRGHNCSVRLLDNWPPSSPDLNPIENLWAWVQAKVDAQGCKTFTEFKEQVDVVLRTVPTSVLEALVGSMKGRMDKVVQLKGGRLAY